MRVLIPFDPENIAGRTLIRRCQSQQLKFIQQVTVSDVRRAKKRGLATVLSLIDKLMYQGTPLPADFVLEKILYYFHFKIDLDEDLDDLNGEGVEYFVCRCIQNGILGRRLLRIIELGRR